MAMILKSLRNYDTRSEWKFTSNKKRKKENIGKVFIIAVVITVGAITTIIIIATLTSFMSTVIRCTNDPRGHRVMTRTTPTTMTVTVDEGLIRLLTKISTREDIVLRQWLTTTVVHQHICWMMNYLFDWFPFICSERIDCYITHTQL
eukprot:PhF_6_TR35771/c0_g1_i1/m.51980